MKTLIATPTEEQIQLARYKFFNAVVEGVTDAQGYDLTTTVTEEVLGPEHPGVNDLIANLGEYWETIKTDPRYAYEVLPE